MEWNKILAEQNQWQAFFDQHAPYYMRNVFTQNTLAEVDFLLEVLSLSAGASILDMGCGTGRHAIELARRGFRIMGVDISAGMLAEARKAAYGAGVEVQWIQADATQFTAAHLYDAALCLCEGAFGLFNSNENPVEHDVAILRNIHAALHPGALFIMTTLNGIAKLRAVTQEDVEQGRFDPLTMTVNSEQVWDLPEGRKRVHVRERYYAPTELVWLCEQVGLRINHIWGGTAGNWGKRPLQLDEIEVMVVASKQ